MKRYRVGRRPPGAWVNVTPPIRRTKADASLCNSGRTADALTTTDNPEKQDTPWLRRRAHAYDEEAKPSPYSGVSKTEYTDVAVQEEIERDLNTYPSLDPEVQENIVRKFRQLHKRLYDENLYDCPYFEYGKEMVRYTALLIACIFALGHGWYLTSAMFLGLFWVRRPPSLPSDNVPKLMSAAPNHVHGSRCRSPRHYTQLRRRYLDRHFHCRFLLRFVDWMVEE